MQVFSASVGFTTQHHFERMEKREQVFVEDGRVISPQNNQDATATKLPLLPPGTQDNINSFSQDENNTISDVQTSLLKALVEAMTGKEIKTGHISEISNTPSTANENTSVFTHSGNQSMLRNEATNRTSISLNLLSEYEYSNVEIQANINSAGETIALNLQVTMERSYTQTVFETLRSEGIITDPLAINFNGDTVSLSNITTSFDLDSDGNAELIPVFNSNSAWIALDKNQDGVINNGTELFGPTVGDGFNELSLFDQDQNNFIDNGDVIFDQLLAFNPQSGQTESLSELGIGALYLGSVDSPFSLTDRNNILLGQVRSTGFYIDKNGQPGSLQQVDLIL